MPTYSRMALNNIINSIERVNSVRSIEDIFLEQLNASIEKTAYDNQKEPSKTYKPSGMNCMRACFYTILGMPIAKEVQTASSVGICESGSDRHERIQKALEAMKANGYDLEYIDVETYIKTHGLEDRLQILEKLGMETKLYMPSLNLSFMTDGIIKFQGIYYIFEFKTEIPTKFYKRTGVDPSHMSQGTAYSCAFDIDKVLFLYENRATCERKPYLFNVTPEMKQERILGFIDECNHYIQEKIIPPMPVNPEVIKKCKYCSYKAKCATHGAGSKLILEEIPNESK